MLPCERISEVPSQNSLNVYATGWAWVGHEDDIENTKIGVKMQDSRSVGGEREGRVRLRGGRRGMRNERGNQSFLCGKNVFRSPMACYRSQNIYRGRQIFAAIIISARRGDKSDKSSRFGGL